MLVAIQHFPACRHNTIMRLQGAVARKQTIQVTLTSIPKGKAVSNRLQVSDVLLHQSTDLNLSNTHKLIQLSCFFFYPHLIALKASVSHGGCRGLGRSRGLSLLDFRLGRHPGHIHDGLRLAQGAGPIFCAGDSGHCGHTL